MDKWRYGFNLDWFLCNSSYRREEKLKYYYEKYYLDYKKFIESLDISEEEKESCLKAEKRCIRCKINYPYTADSFIYFYSGDKEITYKLCYDCIKNISTCVKCGKCINHDPYTKIDIKNIKLICQKCDK